MPYLLNGTNQRITLPDAAALQFGTGDFSCALWFFRAGKTSGQLLSKDFNGFELYIFANQLAAYLGGTANAVPGFGSISNALWYHAALTRSGGECRVWLAGSPSSPVTNTASVSQSGTVVSVGVRPGGTDYFDGYVCHVALWSRALSAEEIGGMAKGMSPVKYPAGLVAHMPLVRSLAEIRSGMVATAVNSPGPAGEPPRIYHG